MTVLFQGLAKASLFHSIRDSHGAEALKSSAAVQCFTGLLFLNILFPTLILAMPHYVSSRVAAALMDAVLDLGYMATSLWLYIVFATSESLSTVFLNNFWNYMSLYVCIAHVLCVCRSLETVDWVVLFQLPNASPIWGAWKRRLFSIVYAGTLACLLGILLGGVFFNAHSGSTDGLCPPCECSSIVPRSLVLELCMIPTGYIGRGAKPTEFDLAYLNITQVLPDAFSAPGFVHQRVGFLLLRGNHLTTLPDGVFHDLLELLYIMDLAHNRLTALPPDMFQSGQDGVGIRELYLESNRLTTLPSGLFAGKVVARELHLQNNLLIELPPGTFDKLSVGRLYLQNNSLTELHPDSFRGMQFYNWDRDHTATMLDMSRNKLQAFPEGAPRDLSGLLGPGHPQLGAQRVVHPFGGLVVSFGGGHGKRQLRSLQLQNNRLVTLPLEPFRLLGPKTVGPNMLEKP